MTPGADEAGEAGRLKALLAISGGTFAIEQAAGWIAESASLIAASLEMFADAAAYGIAVYMAGRPRPAKRLAAQASGWLQAALAMGALAEVVRSYLYRSDPEPASMMGVGLVALAAHLACLALITGHRSAEMRAGWIFAWRDVAANAAVVAAGLLVFWTRSNLPDLVVGAVIAVAVLSASIHMARGN